MIRLVIGLLIVTTLLLTGCTQQAPYIPPVEPPYTPPVSDGSTAVDNTTDWEKAHQDRTWISPGKVQIGNFHAGAQAEWPLTIHNGNDYAASFATKYRVPNKVEEGYAYAPIEARDWVIIADPTPVLMPKETREILITVAMPNGAIAPNKWEFWISVKDTTQAGMVITELCSRWLVSHRQ